MATLNNNQITLSAGFYRVSISAPAYNVNNHQARLYNITDDITLIAGTNEYTNTGVTTRSLIKGEFFISSSKTLELQHRSSKTDIFGLAGNFGEIEIYSIVQLWKIPPQ